MINKRFCVCLL